MEQNQFEGLEEVEVSDVKPEDEVKGLKEYEKLLLAERDREDNEKALNLIKFGCFNQKEETTIDFSKLEKISTPKKYKGLYSLYRSLDTMQLLFVAELIENNKGADDERKDLKPYAYDVIYLEQMDEETYKAVCHAGKNNVSSVLSKLVVCADILTIVDWVIAVFLLIAGLIVASGSYTGVNIVIYALVNASTFILAGSIMLPLLVLMHIKYKKYKDQ